MTHDEKEAEKQVIEDVRKLMAKLKEADDPDYRWFAQLSLRTETPI